MTTNETETQTRLRRAHEAYVLAQENERAAIQALNDARKYREHTKERYSELFQREEQEEIARRLATYTHCTK